MALMRCTFVFLAWSVVWPAAMAAGDASDGTAGGPASASSRLLTMTDVVLERHIDPPARQEMVLAAVKALYFADNRVAPHELGRRVSAMAGRDELAGVLDEAFADFRDLDDAEGVATRAILAAIPGGAYLVDAKGDVVQEQLRANRYVGTGIALGTHGEPRQPVINKVIYNGPAWHAGINKGDVILEIDGIPTAGTEMNEILKLLRGEEGSDVTVLVRNMDSEESRTITMTRGRVFIPTVLGSHERTEGGWEYVLESATDVAVLRITNFGPSTLHELRQVEMQLRDSHLRGIILDLREGGGLLHDVEMVADALIDGGVVGHVRLLDDYRTVEAGPGAMFPDLRMAVLMMKGSNADRVFLAAALQDQDRALVVGEMSADVPYVRAPVPLPGRDQNLIMATGMMYRGDGTLLLGMNRSLAVRPQMPAPAYAPGQGRLQQTVKPQPYIVPNEPATGPRGQAVSDDPFIAAAVELIRNNRRWPSSRAATERSAS